MLRILRLVTVVTVMSGTWAGTAAAQTGDDTRLGSYLMYHFDVRDPGVGAQLDLPVAPRLALYPSGGVFLVDAGSLWGVNADVKYRVASPLYVGGGLSILRRSVESTADTDAGINLLGGLEGRVGQRLHPFAEGRVLLNEGSAFLLGAGLRVAL